MPTHRLPAARPMPRIARAIVLATAMLSAGRAAAQDTARARHGGGDSLGVFPRVAGRSLDGTALALPGDFAGALDLVVVAFARAQQRDVDGWMPFLRGVAAAHPGVRVYELPTLGRGYRFMRGVIDGGMRRGIPDSAARAATVTLYVDKAPFRSELALPDEDRIYVLLVDRTGRVHWRADGPFDERRAAEWRRAIDHAIASADQR